MYIYIPARPHPLQCDCHSSCCLRQTMPNFHCESKVTCRQIFTGEIWHFSRMPWESIDWDHTHLKAKPQILHACKAPKANAKIMFFTANFRKLIFYQNKGLSLDKHCGVSNTSTRNQTFGTKNQDFFCHPH